jgi:hypothetical protein
VALALDPFSPNDGAPQGRLDGRDNRDYSAVLGCPLISLIAATSLAVLADRLYVLTELGARYARWRVRVTIGTCESLVV